MARHRTPTLLHRGYLYAQKHLRPDLPAIVAVARRLRKPDEFDNVSTKRMKLAEAWRAGYLQAMREHAKKAKS